MANNRHSLPVLQEGALETERGAEPRPEIERLLQEGGRLEGSGDFAGAVASFTRVIELDPRNATAHHRRGWARAHQGDLTGELEDWSKTIDLDPAFAEAYAVRAAARVASGDTAGAVSDWQQALHLLVEAPEERLQDLLPVRVEIEGLLPVGNGSLGVTGCHSRGRAIRVGLIECGLELDGFRPVLELAREIAEVRSGPAPAMVSGRVPWIELDRSREARNRPGEVAGVFLPAAFLEESLDLRAWLSPALRLECALLKDR